MLRKLHIFIYRHFLLLFLFIPVVISAQEPESFIYSQKCFGGIGIDAVSDMEPTSDGGFILTGGSLSTDGAFAANHGGYDIWVMKLDADQNIEWQKLYGGSMSDNASKIIQLPGG